MKHKVLKIRPKFIELIKKGIKKNEYRLGDEDKQDINVGDILILVSNQDNTDYVKVVVNSIKKYKDWGSALKNNWKDDFNGLFDNYEELIKECYRFYRKEEVDKYGILVFEVKTYSPSIENSRVLLDTNIIVERESLTNCTTTVNILYNWLDKLHVKKMIHPQTIEELKSYNDDVIKENMLKKINSYIQINPSNEKTDFFDAVVKKYKQDQNSKIDNEILKQVFNGRVDYLITEDKAILKKAEELYIKENVLSPDMLLRLFEKRHQELVDYDVLSVKLKRFSDVNVNDAFFDTLREDYGGASFNQWFNGKSEEPTYVFENEKGIQGFLYLKIEDGDSYPDFEPPLEPKRRLKVGTFKINSTGMRLGERFLKIIFENARRLDVEEIYVTLFKEKRDSVKQLKSLMEEWGFCEKGIKKSTGEVYLLKNMKKYERGKSPKFNYPIINRNANYRFLPILQKYHSRLFPDLHLNNEDMEIYDEEACQYALEKVYVCKYYKNDIRVGDYAFIYRMSDYDKLNRSLVTGLCIINEVIKPKDKDDFVKICKNKSVFNEKELEMFYNIQKYNTIIKVLYIGSYDNKISLKTLREKRLIPDGKGPQLSTVINVNAFKKINNLGKKGE